MQFFKNVKCILLMNENSIKKINFLSKSIDLFWGEFDNHKIFKF